MLFKTQAKKRRTLVAPGGNSRIVENSARKERRLLGEKSPSSGNSISVFIYRFMILVFAAVAVYILFFSPYLVITSIDINGSTKIGNLVVQEFLESELSGKYLGAVTKNNFLLVGTRSLEKKLVESFKLIEGVKITKEFPNKLKVNILERDPSLILCGREKCLVSDKKGSTFDEVNSAYISWPGMLILRDESGKEILWGEKAIDEDYIRFILEFRNRLKEDLGIELEREIRTPALASLDIRVRTMEGWDIYLNQALGVEKELKMLRVIFDSKVESEKRKDLEYVDLRTDNRVYYKFKDQVQENASEKDASKKEEAN